MIDPEKTLNAQWCVDSESGHEFLLDLKTGQVLAEKNEKGEWIYGDKRH